MTERQIAFVAFASLIIFNLHEYKNAIWELLDGKTFCYFHLFSHKATMQLHNELLFWCFFIFAVWKWGILLNCSFCVPRVKESHRSWKEMRRVWEFSCHLQRNHCNVNSPERHTRKNVYLKSVLSCIWWFSAKCIHVKVFSILVGGYALSRFFCKA